MNVCLLLTYKSIKILQLLESYDSTTTIHAYFHHLCLNPGAYISKFLFVITIINVNHSHYRD